MTKRIPNRSILGLNGADAKQLLQGTLTQDINLLDKQPLLYACHLTQQGRLFADCFVAKDDDMYLIDVHTSKLMPLAESLHKYSVGLTIDFHDLTQDYTAITDNTDNTAAPDPRHPSLPHRTIVKGNVPEEDTQYESTRISLAIPDGVRDNPEGKMLPAELGLDHLSAISFKKGCYVGQEVTARLHHRSTPKKRLYTCQLTQNFPIGTPIQTEQNATVGTLLSNANGQALALLQTRVIQKQLQIQGSILKNIQLPEYISN